VGAKPPGSDGLVGIEIHDPVKEAAAAEPGQPGAQERNQRRRGQGHHHLRAGQPREPQRGECQETGKIRGPPPFGAFAKSGGSDAIHADPAPHLLFGKLRSRLIVGAPAGDYGYLVAALDEAQGHVGQVLPGCHDVRVKGLVQEEEGHKRMLRRRDAG